jgi:PAS domain-containing protein
MDQTKRQPAQEQTLDRQASQRASEERFRLLLEGIPNYAIFMIDPTGQIATWNLGA